MQYDDKKIEADAIREILTEAKMCLIYTGAGMGVDSGLSVFRGTDGLWEKYPEAGNLGLDFKSLANPTNYKKYPEVVIPFYLDRYKNYVAAEPHSGYYELFGYVSTMPKGYRCITSNVDGLFEKTGFDNVYNIHGSIHKWQCSSRPCALERGEDGLLDISEKDLSNIEDLRCEHCNEYLRPNICMFYDFDYIDTPYETQRRDYECFTDRYSEFQKAKVAVIEIGAGADLRSIRSMSENTAYSFNTKVIRINTESLQEDLDDPDVILVQKGAAAGVEYIMSLLKDNNL